MTESAATASAADVSHSQAAATNDASTADMSEDVRTYARTVIC